jgi:hypothetical protein
MTTGMLEAPPSPDDFFAPFVAVSAAGSTTNAFN